MSVNYCGDFAAYLVLVLSAKGADAGRGQSRQPIGKFNKTIKYYQKQKKMKKGIFLAITGVVLLLASCSKDDDPAPTCEVTIAKIAATYKITKIVSVTPAGEIDVTATLLEPCLASARYKLNSDKTMTYTELPSCGGDGAGTWDLVGNRISIIHTGAGIDLASANVTSFDCSRLLISTDVVAGAGFKYTFTKQ